MNVRPSLAPKSTIASWGGWPDDVRETVLMWNRQRKLSFLRVRAPLVYFGIRAFRCSWCDRVTRIPPSVCVWAEGGVGWRWTPQGDYVTSGSLVCDPCVVEKARAVA